ncbi:MAG: DedA family protein [Psychromonas sp.]|nr:DedA family protein [Psychromonas sp.]
MNLLYQLFVLFISSFVSATLFPGGSELLLIFYLKSNPADLWWYFSIVTIGNSLGAWLTYLLGYYSYWGRKQAQRKYQKSWSLCQRYGVTALLFSWLPVIGDILPLAAGWLKLAIFPSILSIVIGKAMRYGVIVGATLSLL